MPKLSKPFQKSGRNNTSDNFFTNLELGRKFLMQNLTVVGTIRENRKEIPAEFVSTKDRKEFTTLYGFQKEVKIAFYCPKKENVVTLLSTMHLDKGTESLGLEKKTRSHYLLKRNKRRCRYHGPNVEMIYCQKKNSKMAYGNILSYAGYQRSKCIYCMDVPQQKKLYCKTWQQNAAESTN